MGHLSPQEEGICLRLFCINTRGDHKIRPIVGVLNIGISYSWILG